MQDETLHISHESIKDNVAQELTNLLFASAKSSNTFVVIASIAIYFTLQSVIPIFPLCLWVFLMTLLTGVRLFLCYQFQKKTQSSKGKKTLANLYIVVTAMLGIAWSLLAVLPGAFESIYSQSFITLIMVVVLFIAINVLPMNRLAQILYSIPFPLVIAFVLSNSFNPYSMQFSLYMVIFLMFMIWLGKKQYDSLGKALTIHFTNEILITQLESAIDSETAANRTKSEFLANMSHEIRTPMNGVLGIIELLQDTELSTEQRKFTETIRGSGESLLTIINDILDFSKIEAGKLKLESVVFDLKALLNDVEQMFIKDAQDKNLKFAVNVPNVRNLNLIGDPTRIRQVLINLAANAIKFTEKGEVAIHVTMINQDDRFLKLQISVKDTGIGISSEAQEYLFEPFSQADGSTTRKFGGTGLGLAISSELVSRMGGLLSCDSELGKGANFFFTLQCEVVPKIEAESNQSSFNSTIPSITDVQSQRVTHVLVAEDNETNQEVIFGMLKKLACEVTLVSNGQEAVIAAARKSYGLIFMDCQMPVMDGYQAAAAIRRSEEEGLNFHVPIIALTANALEGDREKCLSAGMDDYISKPFKSDEISNIVTHWSREKMPVGASKPSEESQVREENICFSSVDQSALNAIRDLQIEGEPDILEKIIHAYLSSSTPLIVELRKALVVNDSEVLRNSAHSLKSTSACLGAMKLSELCNILESNCRNNTLENATEQVSAIELEFPRVKVELSREIASE